MARPARGAAVLLTLYSHSLSITLIALFLASFVLHLLGSQHLANDEAMRLGQPVETVLQHRRKPAVLV